VRQQCERKLAKVTLQRDKLARGWTKQRLRVGDFARASWSQKKQVHGDTWAVDGVIR
ncbi:unnamed protein product, partial [Prorocentrum cordatum]